MVSQRVWGRTGVGSSKWSMWWNDEVRGICSICGSVYRLRIRWCNGYCFKYGRFLWLRGVLSFVFVEEFF